jgi:hypothetical protein
MSVPPSPVLPPETSIPSSSLGAIPAAAPPSEVGEGCRTAYHIVPWHTLRITILLCTTVLLIVGVSSPDTLRQGWYQIIEGLVSIVFCVEVFWRARIARSHFTLASCEALVEVGCAVLCCLLLVALLATAGMSSNSHGTLEEALLVLLAVVQAWRILVSLRQSLAEERDRSRVLFDSRRVVAESESETAQLRAAGQL